MTERKSIIVSTDTTDELNEHLNDNWYVDSMESFGIAYTGLHSKHGKMLVILRRDS